MNAATPHRIVHKWSDSLLYSFAVDMFTSPSCSFIVYCASTWWCMKASSHLMFVAKLLPPRQPDIWEYWCSPRSKSICHDDVRSLAAPGDSYFCRSLLNRQWLTAWLPSGFSGARLPDDVSDKKIRHEKEDIAAAAAAAGKLMGRCQRPFSKIYV